METDKDTSSAPVASAGVEGNSELERLSTKRFEIALARFQDHCELLRKLSVMDLQILGGHMTLQFAVAAWFAEHPIQQLSAMLAVTALLWIFGFLAWTLLWLGFKRREEVAEGLKRVRRLFMLDEPGAFLEGESLDPPFVTRRWRWIYLWAVVLATLSVTVVVWGGIAGQQSSRTACDECRGCSLGACHDPRDAVQPEGHKLHKFGCHRPQQPPPRIPLERHRHRG